MDEKIKITIELDEQDLLDVLTTALEGGSNYWYLIDNWRSLKLKAANIANEEGIPMEEIHCGVDKIWLLIKRGIAIRILDAEEVEEYLGDLTMDALKKGAQMYIQERGHFDPCMDAEEADCFFQYAIMGEIVYG